MKVSGQSIRARTVAPSKGLEYRVVFVMRAGLFPPDTTADAGVRPLNVRRKTKQEILQ
jgi:hypothetical protein